MNLKKICAALLSALVLTGGASTYNPQSLSAMFPNAYAAGSYTEGTQGAIKYKKYSGYVEISGCDSSATNVRIPSAIEGVPVKAIGESAFYQCNDLVSVELPESLTSIGNSAFLECYSLSEINIPDSVTEIDSFAFYCCSGLSTISLPSGLTEIKNGVFTDCTGLTSINIPDSVKSIGDQAFSGCENISSVDIPSGVTLIDEYAFSDCTALKKVNIPNTVQTIGEFAFGNCPGLPSVVIPSSVTKIGRYAFGYAYNPKILDYSVIKSFIIYGAAGSAAADYAKNNSITFAAVTEGNNLGDVNGDNKVDSVDAELILAEYSQFDSTQKAAADVNKDGKITSEDARLILVEYSNVQLGMQSAFGIPVKGETASGGYTSAQIAASSAKPVISVSSAEIQADKASGTEIAVTVSLSGADGGWGAAGFHLAYDSALTPVKDSSGNIKYDRGTATSGILCSISTNNSGKIFISAAADNNGGKNGIIATLYFKLPSNCSWGDSFEIKPAYESGDVFTNSAADKLMQASLFTNGLKGGKIDITEPEFTTTTTEQIIHNVDISLSVPYGAETKMGRSVQLNYSFSDIGAVKYFWFDLDDWDLAHVSSDGTITFLNEGTVTVSLFVETIDGVTKSKSVSIDIEYAYVETTTTSTSTTTTATSTTTTTTTTTTTATSATSTTTSSTTTTIPTTSSTTTTTTTTTTTETTTSATTTTTTTAAPSKDLVVYLSVPSDAVLVKGNSFKLEFSFSNSSRVGGSWFNSDNGNVASVQSDGSVKLNGTGTAVITLYALDNTNWNTKTASVTITVTDTPQSTAQTTVSSETETSTETTQTTAATTKKTETSESTTATTAKQTSATTKATVPPHSTATTAKQTTSTKNTTAVSQTTAASPNTTTTTQPAQKVLLGDVNGDKKIDAKDASAVLAEYANRATGGSSKFNKSQQLAADVNKDNKIDAKDASKILAYYATKATGGKPKW